MRIPIIYEDQDLLIIDKPPGIATHQGPGVKGDTIADWLTEHYPLLKGIGENPLRPGIVHRLDKGTSGVMVIAKNQGTFDELKKLFQEHRIEKTYLALVCYPMKEATGTISSAIGRSKKFGKFSTYPRALRGTIREAGTSWRLKKNFRNHALLEIRPASGRTHQIRVHLASIDHPIAGDTLYGKKQCTPQGLTRMFLHAFSLSFSLHNSRYSFEADLPSDLSDGLRHLEE